MAKPCHTISRLINTKPPSFPIHKPSLQNPSLIKTLLQCRTSKSQASAKREEFPQYLKRHSRRNSRPPRRLITISTSDGKWHGEWTCDFVFSLEELQLADLAEDGERNAEVAVSLLIQKHAGFGFSVDGRIITAFNRRCSNCFSPYCKQVIYVKPGCEADLDSLIQDTIRLTTSVKETCSESCEKSPPKWHYIGKKEANVDRRWSRLLEIKTAT